MNNVRSILGFALASMAAAAMAAGPGLAPTPDATWTRWQTRVGVGIASSGGDALSDPASGTARSLSLLGDYYFGARSAAALLPSGFRATSGLVVGPRSSLWTTSPFLQHAASALGGLPAAETGTSPYLGVGYGGVFGRSGWNLSADLGLMALQPAQAIKLGRVFNGAQNLDEALRDLRLAPIVQLGVSYAF